MNIPVSGHFARLILLLTSEVKLRNDEEECNTLHPVMLEVKSKQFLKKLKHRYYKLPWEREYKVLKGNETDLIGKSIMVRSPITCASQEGICKKCYGELFYTNSDLESVGGLAATKNAEPLSQKILSSKHLLNTTSEKIEFTSVFDKFFYLNANEVMVDPEKDDAIENYSLIIKKDDIVEFEEADESNINSLVNVFYVMDKRTGETFDISEVDGKDLFISPTFKDIIEESTKRKGRGRGRKKQQDEDNEYYEIPLVDIGFDDPIFLIEIGNSELTKPLYQIMELLDNKEKRSKQGVETIDDMVQRLIDLYIEADLPIDAVHGEVIIRCIVRSKKDILEFPDFTRYDAMKDVDILTVKSALNNHPSITISLSFQAIGRQFTRPLTFMKKKGSFMDPYFREKL